MEALAGSQGISAPRSPDGRFAVREGAAVHSGEHAASSRTARRTVAAIIDQRVRALFSFCGWCGAPCYGVACRSHDDLPALEREGWAA